MPKKDNTVLVRFAPNMIDLNAALKDMQDNINNLSGDIDLSVSKGNFDKIITHVREQLSAIENQMHISPEVDTKCLEESLKLVFQIKSMLGDVRDNFSGVFTQDDVKIAESLSKAFGLSVDNVAEKTNALGDTIKSAIDPKVIQAQRKKAEKELEKLSKAYKDASEVTAKTDKSGNNI